MNLLIDKSTLDSLLAEQEREKNERIKKWNELREKVDQLQTAVNQAHTISEQKGMLKDGYVAADGIGPILYDINRLKKELAVDFSFGVY